MKNQKLRIENGLIVSPFRSFQADIEINNGIIDSIILPGERKEPGFEILNANGAYITPGLIDLHSHGAGGADFLDLSEESFSIAGKAHLKDGTTTMLPTSMASSFEDTRKFLDIFSNLKNESDLPDFPGVHLEGPYFSPEQIGAQDPRFLQILDIKEYKSILSQYGKYISRWSAAPEVEGVLTFADTASQNNMILSIAHSNATYDDVLEAMEHGFSMLTHFYSGMSGVMRKNAFRHAGIIESGYLLGNLAIELIADGKHLPASLLRLVYKTKDPGMICLVSDSIRAAGLGEGEFYLGKENEGQLVIVEDGVAKLPDRSAFAGSVTIGMPLVKNMMKLSGASFEEALMMMTYNPARYLGIQNRKGRIAPGLDADLLVVNRDYEVESVIKSGIRLEGR